MNIIHDRINKSVNTSDKLSMKIDSITRKNFININRNKLTRSESSLTSKRAVKRRPRIRRRLHLGEIMTKGRRKSEFRNSH